MAEYIEREKIFSIWRRMPDPASIASLSKAISLTPAADVVSRAVYEQTAWERDIAMEQLAAHGIGFGEECETADREGTNCTLSTIEVVRCKECVYYHAKTGWCDELSFFQTADGVPCSPDESADWKMFMEDDFCSRGKRAEDNHESV